MQNTIRIIAAVVDTHNLTLYKENGDTLIIPQGDSRIRPIVDVAVPMLLQHGFADVVISPEEDNSYVQFEAISNGAVKLFRIAKNKLVGLLGMAETGIEVVPAVVPMAIGSIPVPRDFSVPAGRYPEDEEEETDHINKLSAVEEILQHAVPVSSPDFHERDLAQQGNIVEESGSTIQAHSADTEADTIVALVDGKIIPGMEKIKSQFTRAAKLGSVTGVENFLRRLGSVIDQRKHSVEDLLKFLERGDLPIADDGSILIYKVLNRVMDESYKDGKVIKEHGYVDCHSGRVFQFVGAYVCMDASLVDHNRSNECSNGLHVARRGYIGGFGGNVCVLAKLAPEDVIAVPSYDANKMRVCGYHIIAELTPEQFALVKANKPITDDVSGKYLLARALEGVHIGKSHEVRITSSMGGGVQVTELSNVKAKVNSKAEVPVAEALANPGAESKAAPVDPKDVVEQVEQLSRKDMAAKLVSAIDIARTHEARATAIADLKAFKKSAKVGWDKLGISQAFVDNQLGTGPATEVVGPETKVVTAATPVKAEAKRVVNGVELGEGSPRERIQKILAIGLTSVGVAQAIMTLKKQSKKSWEVLGVNDTAVAQITKLVSDEKTAW